MEPPRIRAAHPDDAPAIAPLLDELGYPSAPEAVRARLAAVLARPEYGAWVGERDGEVVGFAGACVGYYFERDGVYGRLLALVVAARARGAGIGGMLVRAAEGWIVERGGEAVLVNSGRHRAEAHRFYERAGYAATGLRFVKPLTAGPGRAAP